MIKEALQYIVGLKAPVISEIGGQTYSDKELKRISHNPYASSIDMRTLTSLVDYIKSGVDKMQEKMVIQVVSPTEVRLFSKLDDEREREYMVAVKAQLPAFRFGEFIEHETFCINLQSKFIDNGDRALIMKFAGTVEAGSIDGYGDDGITQKASVKTGIVSKGEAIVPNPVNLKPYRTFLEVEQPESSFIFRMKQDKYDGIVCAVFEADGGAWKNESVLGIKEYLSNELKSYADQFTIIS